MAERPQGRIETAIQESLSAELDLDAEWKRQADIRVKLGFHKAAGFPDTGEGKQAFLDSLPKFGPQPEEYKGRFDNPRLVIGGTIPWEKQAKLAGISLSDYQRERIAQTFPRDERSKAPQGSYTAWVNEWGQRFEDPISPDDAVNQLKEDEVGGNPFEAISDHLADPGLNASGKFWDVIGYKVGSGHVPYLGRWYGRPRFGAYWGDDAVDRFRPLVRGGKIVTG